MKKPARVMLVSPLPPPAGGIARWTKMLLNHAREASGVELQLINTAVTRRSLQQNSRWRRISAGIPPMLGAAKLLKAAIRRTSVDVLHINASGQFSLVRDLVLATIARRSGVPVIYHLRFGRVPEIATAKSLEWKLLSMVIRKAQATITLDSRSYSSIVSNLPTASVELIPNFINVKQCEKDSAFPALEGQGKYVLFAGWVIPAKGIEELIGAWYEVAPPGWRLLIAGGHTASYLNSIGLKPGANRSIEVLGEISHDQVLKLMSGCEIFVLPSHTEGFPNSVLEAMTLGRAVIATDVGAVREMLGDGCGRVVAPKSREELSAALDELMKDIDGRQLMGESARRKVDREYSLETVFERYATLWSSAAESRRAAPAAKRTAKFR